MNAKATRAPAAVTYSYASVERALARVFDVDEIAQRGWFRARLQNYRRLGLRAARPGKGKTVAYTFTDIAEWLLGLELAHLRVDPTFAVDVLNDNRAQLREVIKHAAAAKTKPDEVFISVRLRRISDPPEIGTTTLRGMNSFGQWLSDSDDGARRAGIFNLTARLRALDAALDAEKPLS